MMSALINAALESDIQRAREIHYRLLPLMNANFIESNPIPVKAALAAMGMIEEMYRLPLVKISESNREKLLKVVETLGLLQTVSRQ
jgi:4-hydroxy-tetrahydrodipicolinate synthase